MFGHVSGLLYSDVHLSSLSDTIMGGGVSCFCSTVMAAELPRLILVFLALFVFLMRTRWSNSQCQISSLLTAVRGCFFLSQAVTTPAGLERACHAHSPSFVVWLVSFFSFLFFFLFFSFLFFSFLFFSFFSFLSFLFFLFSLFFFFFF